jgi:hypothetical protein
MQSLVAEDHQGKEEVEEAIQVNIIHNPIDDLQNADKHRWRCISPV